MVHCASFRKYIIDREEHKDQRFQKLIICSAEDKFSSAYRPVINRCCNPIHTTWNILLRVSDWFIGLELDQSSLVIESMDPHCIQRQIHFYFPFFYIQSQTHSDRYQHQPYMANLVFCSEFINTPWHVVIFIKLSILAS